MQLNGVINLYKPPGITSAQAVAFIKRIFNQKTGHAGTLDPEAAGVLPILIGQGTRINDYLMEEEKVYLAEISFGVATDTQDAQGTIVKRGTDYPSKKELLEVFDYFRGEILQIPPQYSALKVGGKPAYELARKGLEAKLKSRKTTIYQLDLLSNTKHGCWMMRVRCSKGTYIRTLCNDIGEKAGCPAHMKFLLRERTGQFNIIRSATLEEVKKLKQKTDIVTQKWYYNISEALSGMPSFQILKPVSRTVLNGAPVPASSVFGSCGQETEVCLFVEERLLGIYKHKGNDYLPLRVFAD